MGVGLLFVALIFIAIGWTARHPRADDVVHFGMRPTSSWPWWIIAAALIVLAALAFAGLLPQLGLLR